MDVGEGVEVAHRAEIAHQRAFEHEIFALAVDAFARGALSVDELVEQTAAIERDADLRPGLPVHVLDTALAFGELLMLTGLASCGRKEQRAAKALGTIAIGVLEVGGGMHGQADGTQRDALGGALVLRMPMLIERDGGHPSAKDAGLVDIPGIKGGIGGDMGGKAVQDGEGLQIKRHEVGDVVLVERLGVLGQDHIAVLRQRGTGDAGAIAPEILFDLFGGAIGLLLVGALLDTQTAIGITCGLLLFVIALRHVGARIVLTDMGIDVGDIKSHHLAQVGDFALERMHGLGEHIGK